MGITIDTLSVVAGSIRGLSSTVFNLVKDITKGKLLHLVDIVFIITLTMCAWLSLTVPAQAYVDPSVMTYAIQALAGVAVALSAVIGVAFRRSRRVIMRWLHIDENSNKYMEPDVEQINSSQKAAVDAAAKAEIAEWFNRTSSKNDSQNQLSFKSRFFMALLVVAALVFTFVIVAPFEMVAGNEDSLTYGLLDIWSIFVGPALTITLVLALIISLFRGRYFNAALMVCFGLVLASYIQALVLNGTLPSADGATVNWADYTKITCMTFVAWAAILVAPYVLSCFNRKLMQKVACGIAAILIVVQGVGVASLFVNANAETTDNQAGYIFTEDGLFTVSSKSNVIVFVLDMYDTVIDLIPDLENNPDLLQEMTGFTWFKNSTAVITPTRDAIPAMLTGEQPNHDTDVYEYITSRYEDATYLSDLKASGYSVGLYEGVASADYPYFYENAMNVRSSDDFDSAKYINKAGTFKQLLECALFRDLPWCFKPFFWFYTDDINQAMASGLSKETYDAANTAYTTDDPSYANKLHTIGLSATDTEENGAFRFIHLKGAHYPYTMDENENAGSGFSRSQQSVGAMNIVSDYLRQLKELGLYDEATIIITADHGYFESHDPFELTDKAVNPIMLVKPSQTAEEASQPLVISEQPVSNDDVMPTALANIDGVRKSSDDVNMLTEDNMERVRYFCLLSKSEIEHGLVQYEITGDANDVANWHPTGWIYHYPEGYWEYREDS